MNNDNLIEQYEQSKNNPIIVYCDGGCRNNQSKENIGAWAALLKYGDSSKMLSGHEINTTNNKMELLSCLRALNAIKNKSIHTIVYSDSKYLVEGLNDWIYTWIKNRWVNAKKKPILNQELWLELFKLKIQFMNIEFIHVKGHAGNDGNELVDAELNRVMDDLSLT